MNPSYRHNRLSADFVNLTDETIRLYEVCSGEIWTFSPSTSPIPEAPDIKPDAPLVHYIVEPEMAEKLEQSGRPLDDIAIIHHESIGRSGYMIASLVWGKRPSTKVLLYREFKKNM